MEAHRSHDLIQYAKVQVDRARERRSAAGRLPPADLVPGYSLQQEIHRGGQGIVFRAVHDATQRLVAVKILRWHELPNSAEVQRFAREIRILASLHQPNIVSLHDGGIVGDYRYFVMDFIHGLPFDEQITQSNFSIDETLQVFQRVCDAVQAAHVRGIVHRDLKPRNILVDAQGEPHVLDFGLGKILRDDSDEHAQRSRFTQTGLFVGSIPWIAPEQARGEQAAVDARTDVYALGLILFYTLTSRFPFETDGSAQTVLSNITSQEPARPGNFARSISADLETIILKCLSKDPARRYQSARELGLDIQRCRRGQAIDARRDSTWYVFTKAVNRHRAAALVAFALFVTIIAYSITTTILLDRANSAERMAQKNAEDARDMLAKFTGALGFVVDEVSSRLRNTSGASAARAAILHGTYEHLLVLDAERTGDPRVDREIAKTLMELGDLALELGDINAAEEHFGDALSIRTALAKNERLELEHQIDVSISLVRIGDVAKQRRNLQQALEFYGHALAIDEMLVEQNPERIRLLDNLLWSYERMGAASRRLGVHSDAVDFVQKQAELAERLLSIEPGVPSRIFGVFCAYQQRYFLAQRLGPEQDARQFADQCIQTGEQLIQAAPDDSYYVYRFAGSLADGAVLDREQNRFAEAAQRLKRASNYARTLHQDEPEYVAYHKLLCVIYLEQYRISECLPDPSSRDALPHLKQAEAHAQRILELSPDDPAGWNFAVDIRYSQALLEHSLGHEQAARERLESALATAGEAAFTSRASVNLLNQLAVILRDPVLPEFRDLEGSRRAAQRAVELSNETSAGALHELGLTLNALGEADHSHALLKKALLVAEPRDVNHRRRIEHDMFMPGRATQGENKP